MDGYQVSFPEDRVVLPGGFENKDYFASQADAEERALRGESTRRRVRENSTLPDGIYDVVNTFEFLDRRNDREIQKGTQLTIDNQTVMLRTGNPGNWEFTNIGVLRGSYASENIESIKTNTKRISDTMLQRKNSMNKEATRRRMKENDVDAGDVRLEHDMKSLLGDVGTDVVAHFFLGWKGENVPHVSDPYKYRLVNKQHGSAYSEFSEWALDNEEWIADILFSKKRLTAEDKQSLKDFGAECDRIFSTIDGANNMDEKTYTIPRSIKLSDAPAMIKELTDLIKKNKVKEGQSFNSKPTPFNELSSEEKNLECHSAPPEFEKMIGKKAYQVDRTSKSQLEWYQGEAYDGKKILHAYENKAKNPYGSIEFD
jgi:hypothetical protein